MLAQEIIRTKRNKLSLSEAQINAFVGGITTGSWSEGQIAALAMAVYFNGMTMDERVCLTRAMMQSGHVLHWDAADLGGPALDKHSTGGVGDKVSLMLAPIVAACGGFVPMISGRGLGHTGGTLDKFDSIAGYQTAPSLALFQNTVKRVGCAIIGQTADLAPADKRLYGIRDVTATVESIPLITASILSKKLAAGLHGLVMDVKTGNGAFAAELPMAQDLARSLVSVANGAGLPTTAHITDMNQVLGSTAGNSIEMLEAVQFLKNQGLDGGAHDARLVQVTLHLCADMLLLGRLATSFDDALAKCRAAWQSGAALDRFARMVSSLGGPADFVERPQHYLAAAPVVVDVPALQSGVVSAMQTRDIGITVIELGGGRRTATDVIDHRVGISHIVPVGTVVQRGDPIARVHAKDAASAQAAVIALQRHIQVADAGSAGAASAVETPVLIERLAHTPTAA